MTKPTTRSPDPPKAGHTFWPKLKTLCRDLVLLFAIGAVAVSFLFMTGLASTSKANSGVTPYYHEVAQHCFSVADMAQYIALVGLYAATLEIILRLIQAKTERWVGVKISIAITAFLYGLTHFKFHTAGAFYALLLGCGTAWFYWRCRRWKSLVVWHVLWELSAIAFVILSAVTCDGQARRTVLEVYKHGCVVDGKLQYVERWGWRDVGHFPDEKISALTEVLDRARKIDKETVRHSIHWKIKDVWGVVTRHRFEYLLRLPEDATLEQCHAAASAVYWDSAHRHEVKQSEQAVLLGGPISAFAYEDLSSVLLAAYVTRPCQHEAVFVQDSSVEQKLKQWDQGVREWVHRKVQAMQDVAPEDTAVELQLRKLIAVMQQTNSYWEFTGDSKVIGESALQNND